MSDRTATPGAQAGGATGGGRDRIEQVILDVVFADAGQLTRVDIATRTGLSKPTVNAAVRRLEQEGVLAPAGMQTGRQGRVATFYELASTAGAVVAVELNPTVIRVAVSDLLGVKVTYDQFAPPQSRGRGPIDGKGPLPKRVNVSGISASRCAPLPSRWPTRRPHDADRRRAP